MKFNNNKIPEKILLLGMIFDKVNLLLWTKTKDAEKGINRPHSLVNAWLGIEKSEKENLSFKSGEDFERARREIIEKGG